MTDATFVTDAALPTGRVCADRPGVLAPDGLLRHLVCLAPRITWADTGPAEGGAGG
jgi:hypothetical protein